jgi:mRNA interferase MazF
MARILRGDIRWADLGPARGHVQAGNRPVLVLSADVFNERTRTVIAASLTSREPRAGFPLSLEIQAAGLPRRSWVLMGQIATLSAQCLGRSLARASEEDLARVVEGLNEIVD